jgi:hypothetical protein
MEERIYQTKKRGYLIIACQKHGDLLNARLEYFQISGDFFIGCEFSEDIVKACAVINNFVQQRDGFRFEDTLPGDEEFETVQCSE